MAKPFAVTLLASYLSVLALVDPACAENRMGYRLFSSSEAAAMPRGGGVLGLNVGRGEQIRDNSGMTFELLRVNGVRRASPGERAGIRTGDQIIAVDGRVFPNPAAFASYVGSKQPGEQISIDTMPASGGPKDAQRLSVTLGSRAPAAQTQSEEPAPRPTGLSTGSKIAIGLGAAALFGCYEYGCFSHRKGATPAPAEQR